MSKTLRITEPSPSASQLTESSRERLDALEAIVAAERRCCDLLGAGPSIASAVNVIATEQPSVIRSAGGLQTSVETSGDRGVRPEVVSATAAMGRRCAYIGATADVETGSSVFQPGIPCVTVLAGFGRVESRHHFELIANSAQEAADLVVIAHALSELSLCPGVVRIDRLDPAVFEAVDLPTDAVIRDMLGDPSDQIETPTRYQSQFLGTTRSRIPDGMEEELDGIVLLRDVATLSEQVFGRFSDLTGRAYSPLRRNGAAGPDAVIIASPATARQLESRLDLAGAGIGLVAVLLRQPFPAASVLDTIAGSKVVVAESTPGETVSPAERVRECLDRATANALSTGGELPHPDVPALPDGMSRPRLSRWVSQDDDSDLGQLRTILSESGLPPLKLRRKKKISREAEGVLTAVIRSSRALRIARRISGSSVFENSPVWVRLENARLLNMWIGSAASVVDDGVADVMIVPGSSRRGLEADLAGIRPGGFLVLEGNTEDNELLWEALPSDCRATIRDREINLFIVRPKDAESAFEHVVAKLLLTLASGASSRNGDSAAQSLPDGVSRTQWQDLEDRIDEGLYDNPDVLRLESDPSAETSGELSLQSLLAFHHGGRGEGKRLWDTGLIPPQLHAYVTTPLARGPFPICLSTAGPRASVSLTALIDRAIGETSEDDADVTTRHLLKVETEIRRLAATGDPRPLSEVWSAAGETVLQRAGKTSEENDVLRKLLSNAGKHLKDDGPLLTFSRESVIRLLVHSVERRWDDQFITLRENAEGLAIMMEEFLRAESDEQSAGDPEANGGSRGQSSYAEEVDFGALSRMLEVSHVSDSMSQEQRRRRSGTERDLRDLPEKLKVVFVSRSDTSDRPVHVLSRAIAAVDDNLRVVASLAKAVRVASLEVSGGYRDEHDALFDTFGVEHLTDEERELCPPCVADIGDAEHLSPAELSLLTDVLASDLPIKVVVTTGNVTEGPTGTSGGIRFGSRASHLSRQAVALGTAYCAQAAAADTAVLFDAASGCAAFAGPAFLAVHVGSPDSVAGVTDYFSSAMARESRAFPSFVFDPDGGEAMSDRFRLDSNPALGDAWSTAEVSYSAPDGTMLTMNAAFTAADFFACDGRFGSHFLVLGHETSQSGLLPLSDFIGLAEANTHVPFIWMADEGRRLHRVAVSAPVADACRRVRADWNALRALGGIDNAPSSVVLEQERLKLEVEKAEALDEAERRHQETLDKTTGDLARDIVANIAAGLLGLQDTGVPSVLPRKVAPKAGAAPAAGHVAEPEQPEADTAPPAREEEEEVISLDEPYIETPRCTSCNECTTINPRMFAYDQNKQAFIKDASAGTYRELVDSAEKCPVRIIHPGKPADPNESGLDELLERAKPFR